MALTFYPHEDDLEVGSLLQKAETLMEAAERYKAVILDAKPAALGADNATAKKNVAPRDLVVAFNWDQVARLLREIREMPESNQPSKLTKAQHLTKLAEIYEVLRGAKMPKLEAVRLALMNEANQLRASASQG